jgi:hypothetical protein
MCQGSRDADAAPVGPLSRALRGVKSPANIGRRQVHREVILRNLP